jgi:hypothetical protein
MIAILSRSSRSPGEKELALQMRVTRILVIVNFSLLLCLGGWTNVVAQNNKRTVIRRLTVVKYPVELSFKLKGQPLESNETVLFDQSIRTNEFEADADWLRDFTISLKNTSGKTITYILLNLRLPEVAKNDRTATHQVFLGIDPDRKFSRTELRLAPNEVLDIPLAPMYTDLKTLVKVVWSGLAIENLSKLDVEFHAALLDDGPLFEAGMWYRRNPDPNDPQRWIVIKEN